MQRLFSKKLTLHLATFLALLVVGIFADQAYAAVLEYKPLVNVPGLTDIGESPSLFIYLKNLYVFVVAFSILFAVIFIVWGGIKYMTSEAGGSKEDAKKIIQRTIYGLLLILGSYAILNTINPDLLTFRGLIGTGTQIGDIGLLTTEERDRGTGGWSCVFLDTLGVPGGYKCYPTKEVCNMFNPTKNRFVVIPCLDSYENTVFWCATNELEGGGKECRNNKESCETELASSACEPLNSSGETTTSAFASVLENEPDVRNILCNEMGIQINRDGCNLGAEPWCKNETQTECTSVGGLSPRALLALDQMKKGCDAAARESSGVVCEMTVTGGNEIPGHETHGPDRDIVDVWSTPEINGWVVEQINSTLAESEKIDNPPPSSTADWYTATIGGVNANILYEGNHWHICFESESVCKSSYTGG